MVEVKYTKTRKELQEKYFNMFGSSIEVYGKGNMGMIALLSDVQHGYIGNKEYYDMVLNDIKSVLSYEEGGE